ncbi:uncharacterized protein LOC130737021 [Lotus japonicus]|uniref:uncharacterized protein LOC130737021 n=1 Tax=Lotus japonicus TaxID=34305 RepID=UPI0025845657|nr:uncharacterized protein LOC130737021 [Lotus japonicus]
MELLAIQKGLNHVWEMGYKSVVCYTDCIQATEVLGMNFDIANYWHREEIETIRGLLQRNWRVIISHVDREDNQVADALARLASHENWVWKLWSQPPIAIIPLLCQDTLVS